jgi:hypothetical protein
MRRGAGAAHARKIDRERREHTLTADPTTLSDSELSGSIFQVQTMLRTRDASLYGTVDEPKKARLTALLDEQTRRRGEFATYAEAVAAARASR